MSRTRVYIITIPAYYGYPSEVAQALNGTAWAVRTAESQGVRCEVVITEQGFEDVTMPEVISLLRRMSQPSADVIVDGRAACVLHVNGEVTYK